jgi:hypothetical protein
MAMRKSHDLARRRQLFQQGLRSPHRQLLLLLLLLQPVNNGANLRRTRTDPSGTRERQDISYVNP